jgi:glycosyltransferase involved in cell wall biosynthesis
VHQSIPFFDYKFNFLKDSKVWVYKNIIGKMIINSCRDVDEIIVQTQWMKNAIVKKTKINENKITVKPPEIEKKDLVQYNELNNNEKIYFYPANASIYKNHKVIIDACKILKLKGISYTVLFTLKGNENKNTIKLYKISKENNLSRRWLGYISKKEVFDLYSKSILLFPSYIETFGLPLLEARESGTPLLAADTPFSNEICKNYNKINYFNYKDCNQLADLMGKI